MCIRDSVNADLQKLAEDGTVQELAEKYEIADMVSLKASEEESEEAVSYTHQDVYKRQSLPDFRIPMFCTMT